MMTNAPETAFLRRCCAASLEGPSSRDSVVLPEEGLDWRVLLRQAREDKVSPLLHRYFSRRRDPREKIPEEILDGFASDYYGVAAKNAVLLARLAALLPLLQESGYPCMVLKGAALAETVYANPALRPMNDVDILVRATDLPDIHKLLTANGYVSPESRAVDFNAVPRYYLTSLVYLPAGEAISFHLHWHFVNSTIPNSRTIDAVPMERIWEDARRAVIADTPTLTMAPHHQLIHLAEHCMRVTHSVSRLIYLCDLHATVLHHEKDLDWEIFLRESGVFGLSRLLYHPLSLASRDLGCPIPREVLSALRPARMSMPERLFESLARAGHRRAGFSYLLHFAHAPGIAGKAHFVWKTLFPPERVVAQRRGTGVAELGPMSFLRRFLEVVVCGWRSCIDSVRKSRVLFLSKK